MVRGQETGCPRGSARLVRCGRDFLRPGCTHATKEGGRSWRPRYPPQLSPPKAARSSSHDCCAVQAQSPDRELVTQRPEVQTAEHERGPSRKVVRVKLRLYVSLRFSVVSRA